MLEKIGKKYSSEATKEFGCGKNGRFGVLILRQHLAPSGAVVTVVKVF